MMRAQLLRERLFVIAAVDRNSLKTHLSRVLNNEMAYPTDTVNCDYISSTSAGVSQSVVNRHTSTHERPGLFRRNFIRNCRESSRGRNHVLRVSTIEIDARNFAIDAHCEVTTTTLLTHKIMATMPTNTNT